MPLEARDVSYRFPGSGRPEAVAGVTLRLEPGERLAVIGPNGSGKSTLLRLLAGLLTPTSGSVELETQPLTRLRPAALASRLAYIPQTPRLAFPFDLHRFVGFGRHAFGGHGLSGHIAGALQAVDLADRAHEPVGTLSQGQQQRASIARALCQLAGEAAGVSRVLIADEPTAALDPRHDREIMELFRRLSERGTALIASLHDLAAAAGFDRVLVMGPDGRPIALDTPEAALSPDPLRAAFGIGFEAIRSDAGEIRAIVTVG